jgi:hypothetical protein
MILRLQMGIEPNPGKSTELSNLQTADSAQGNQVIILRDLRDNAQGVPFIAAIFRQTGCTQMMTGAATAR